MRSRSSTRSFRLKSPRDSACHLNTLELGAAPIVTMVLPDHSQGGPTDRATDVGGFVGPSRQEVVGHERGRWRRSGIPESISTSAAPAPSIIDRLLHPPLHPGTRSSGTQPKEPPSRRQVACSAERSRALHRGPRRGGGRERRCRRTRARRPPVGQAHEPADRSAARSGGPPCERSGNITATVIVRRAACVSMSGACDRRATPSDLRSSPLNRHMLPEATGRASRDRRASSCFPTLPTAISFMR
jgi:hypothetical protein